MGKKKNKASEEPTQSIKILQKNKKAFWEYEIFDRYECGIILLGAEVKSIREQKLQFIDSHARIKNKKIFLHNMHISPYKFYTDEAIDPLRTRELLLKKIELKKITRQIEEKGRTLVPLAIYLKRGLIKIEIGVAKGKKLHDKKESLKAKTADREAAKEAKQYFKN